MTVLADLPLQIDDAFFEYSEEAWARVLATLSESPGVDPNIRDQLEDEAWHYRWSTARSKKSPEVLAERASATRLLKTANAFLLALDSGIDPMLIGFGCCGRHENGTSEWFDPDLAKTEFEDLRRRVSLTLNKSQSIANDEGFRGPRGGIMSDYSEGRKGEKAVRRQLLEHIVQIWHAFTGRKLSRRGFSCDDMGGLLDFVEAVTRPVLVGADMFGHGESGRDALGKAIDVIRDEGFKYWRYDLDWEYQLSEHEGGNIVESD